MLPRTFNIGPLTFHLYGLIIAIAIAAGLLVAKRRAKIYKVSESLFEDPILLIPLILAVVGARLYHVLDYWSYYSASPSQIIKLTNGGLGIWGGLIGIFIGIVIVAKIRKIKLLPFMDTISPALLLGQAIGRLGNYINQEAFGPPTKLPWGIYIAPENRPVQFEQYSHFHPTFFYEMALDLIFFFVLLKLSRKFRLPGQTFAFYLILYSFGRFIVEFFRFDTWHYGPIKVAQVLSVIAIAYSFWLLKSAKRVTSPRV